MGEIEYRVAKSLTGKWSVHYQCPSCKEGLKNSIDDAGKADVCPRCKTEFVVLGLGKKQQIEAEQKAKLSEKEAEKLDRLSNQEKRQARADNVGRQASKQAITPEAGASSDTGAFSENLETVGEPFPPIEVPIRRTSTETALTIIALLEFAVVKLIIFASFNSGMG
jgi:Zn-finger nucleic acid-binding protein